MSDADDKPDEDIKLVMHDMKSLGIARSDEGRETSAIARVAHHLDVAERIMLETGVGASALQRVMAELGVKRRRATKLLIAAQKRLDIEGRNTTRETRKNINRKRLEEGLQAALNRERAVTYSKAPGLHDVKFVKDPDMRSAASFMERLIKLDGLDGDLPNESKAAPDVRRIALTAIAKAVGADIADIVGAAEEPEEPDDK